MAEKKKASSGAKKAEKLTRKSERTTENTAENEELANLKSNSSKAEKSPVKPAPKRAKKQGAEKKEAKKTDKKPTKKQGASKNKKEDARRAVRAERNAERKKLREARRLAIREKKVERAAALKEKREQRRAKRLELKARREERRVQLKSESRRKDRNARIAAEKKAKREERRAKHEAYLAEKKAKREHALRVREQRRAERSEKRRTPGFGGWLAAVISLGVTTLALGTVVTYGAMNMNNMQVQMASGYTRSLYELNAVIDNLDADLSRARVSSSVSDRVRVFSDIAIESETAETILERFPLGVQLTENMASFINKMGDSAKSMLYTVAEGGELSPSQIKSLDYMYETNARLKETLNELISSADLNDVLGAMRGKDGALGEGFTTIQNNTFEDPKGIQDGPFSDSVKKTEVRALKDEKEIGAQDAERLACEYFKDYKVRGARCTGEAAGEALTLYNVAIDTPDGEMLAQISKLGGKLVEFDSYKDCSDKNFSVENCIEIAERFLSGVGYGRLKPVWVSENGVACNINFAPERDGAILYPDLVKVKVCEERGKVIGVEAMSYVLNHGERQLTSPAITKDEARESVNGGLEIKGERLALIPFDGGERLCYEFCGRLGGREYYVYVDAVTGEEIEVLTVVGTAQGRALM